MNQDEWVEGSLKESKERVISTSNVQTPVPNSKHQNRVNEEAPHSNQLMKEFILQHNKPNLDSSLISEDKQLEIIDLGETEVSTSTNIPQNYSSASLARDPLQIIQHTDAKSSEQ